MSLVLLCTVHKCALFVREKCLLLSFLIIVICEFTASLMWRWCNVARLCKQRRNRGSSWVQCIVGYSIPSSLHWVLHSLSIILGLLVIPVYYKVWTDALRLETLFLCFVVTVSALLSCNELIIKSKSLPNFYCCLITSLFSDLYQKHTK